MKQLSPLLSSGPNGHRDLHGNRRGAQADLVVARLNTGLTTERVAAGLDLLRGLYRQPNRDVSLVNRELLDGKTELDELRQIGRAHV